jgi:alpha-amylase
MGVLLQCFYYNCPQRQNREFEWWNYINEKLPQIAADGFSALWLPPAGKGANIFGMSMGYDPYDYYDLGEFDQRGGIKTWFGSRQELESLISNSHDKGLQVYADFVFNHNSGADETEVNPLDGQTRWTKFNPRSNKFSRNWECFHPSIFDTYDNERFGGMPDLCHRNPYVYQNLVDVARWMIEAVGFDGFRYDFVRGYGSWFVASLQDIRYFKNGKEHRIFGVGELWNSEDAIQNWLIETNNFSDNAVNAFDFPLRYRLKEMCDSFGFQMSTLANDETLTRVRPQWSVTFVDNHDFDQFGETIINDKLLAYAYILTHEGYPCVFWYDYFNLELAREGTPNGIQALVSVHEHYAAGPSTILYADNDLYVMQRNGLSNIPGLVMVINNRGDEWKGTRVQTQWVNRAMQPIAWYSGSDNNVPLIKTTDEHGWADFWAPPRGYAIYIPS